LFGRNNCLLALHRAHNSIVLKVYKQLTIKTEQDGTVDSQGRGVFEMYSQVKLLEVL